MGRKRGRNVGDFEDQYGEAMLSQDRGDRPAAAGRGSSGFSGGGDAGGGSKDRDVHVVRSVPKFLQGHMHLLGRKPPRNEEEELAEADGATVEDEGKSPGDPREEDQEALEKAVLDDPSLVDRYPELKAVADRGRAQRAKEAGNQAFAAKDYPRALRLFTEAIELHGDPVYFSNRAAAYQALGEHAKAVKDARRVIALDQQWVKGWMRLAAALSSLGEWSEAREACEAALKLEPDDRKLESMRATAETNERKEEADRVVKFKQSRRKAGGHSSHNKSDAAKRSKVLLSFGEEENDDEEGS